jgi:VWFA-related protein
VLSLKVGRAASCAAVWLLGGLSLAAATTAAHLTLQRLDVSRLPEIACYFTVSDEKGDSLLGLVESDFQLRVDNLPRRITRLSSAIDDGKYLAVALLVDGSGSMRPHLAQIRQAGTAFIERTSRHDQVAVFSCNEALTRHQDFSSDRELTRKALTAIKARGNTALHDAIAEVLAIFKTHSAQRQALVVLTDGRDNRSRSSADESIRLARAAGVSLYAVGLGPGSDDNALRRLAVETGGEFFKAAAAADLLSLYRRIGAQLRNQYILFFDLGSAGDGARHEMRLEFRSPDGKQLGVDQPFVAAVSPTMAPSAISSLQRRVRRQRQYGQALPGALLGLFSGLLLLGLLKLLRPSAPLFSWPGLALVGALALLGAVLAVLKNWI